jgi:hypothetical protein
MGVFAAILAVKIPIFFSAEKEWFIGGFRESSYTYYLPQQFPESQKSCTLFQGDYN